MQPPPPPGGGPELTGRGRGGQAPLALPLGTGFSCSHAACCGGVLWEEPGHWGKGAEVGAWGDAAGGLRSRGFTHSPRGCLSCGVPGPAACGTGLTARASLPVLSRPGEGGPGCVCWCRLLRAGPAHHAALSPAACFAGGPPYPPPLCCLCCCSPPVIAQHPRPLARGVWLLRFPHPPPLYSARN